MKYYAILFYVLILLIAACQRKSDRVLRTNEKPLLAATIASDTVSKSLVERLEIAINNCKIEYTTFAAKVKIDIQKLDDNTNFTAAVRMQKDSLIWASISPALGIEAARVLVRPDSIFILDRINKKGIAKPFSYLLEKGIPFDFVSLQEAIVGGPIYYYKAGHKAFASGNSLLLISSNDTMRSSFSFDNTSLDLIKILIDDITHHRSVTYQLGGYQATVIQGQQKRFAAQRELLYSPLENQKITLEISNAKWNEAAMSFPFSIPNHYTIEK